jgi:CxxC-x17-CxxC domain-containing protein
MTGSPAGKVHRQQIAHPFPHGGEATMDVQFVDRILICSDCHGEFVFTAGEQLFFHDKQFKNDPKRCKPCKSRRSGLSAAANGGGPAAAGLSRTETRTECSECGVQTTVPFKPTQGRPVLCRQCFQTKTKALAALQPVDLAAAPSPAASPLSPDQTVPGRGILSAERAVSAAASMAAASPRSSLASTADLATIIEAAVDATSAASRIPTELLAAAGSELAPGEHIAGRVESAEA